MAVYRILGQEVLTRSDYLERRRSEGTEPEGARLESAQPLNDDFATPAEVETSPGATQFVAVGLNKPLTILIRHIYTGRHPKSLFGGGKPMAVVTGLKDYSAFAASSRAINYLEKAVESRHHFRAPPAFNEGTNVVAYSPAVVSDSLTFTIEIAFDRFPDTLMGTIAGALTSAAGIPLLIPAQGYLLGAGALLKIGADWADAFIDGRASFSVTDTLDFNMPGVAPPAADFRVLTQDWDPTGFTYKPGKGLIDRDGGQYAGDEPYVVISLDGAERKGLESFAATVATAGVLKSFFNLRDGAEASVEALMGALRLANDLKFRDEAKTVQAQLAGEAKPEKKAALEARLEALRKNILSDALKLA